MREFAADSFYHDWLNNPQPGEYWKKLSPKYLLQDVDLPMLHIGGWFDPYLRGTLNLYRAMSQKSQYPQHLIVGPWAHLPWGRKLGAVDYETQAQNPIDEIQIRWFDYFLKGKDTGISSEAPISLFEMGSNQWRYLEKFPDSATTYYLASDGLASMREDSGMLWEAEKDDNLTLKNSNDLSTTSENLENYLATDIAREFPNTKDIIVHDPWRAVPALGGHASFSSGSFDRSSLDCRSDILTYTSYPLETDLHIVGTVTVELYCEADKPSFDLCAVLSEVYPNGKVFNFTQGYIKINSLNNPIAIPLQATCIKIAVGNSLRLSLSGACFPAYPVNSGTGKALLETHLIDNQIITISIRSGADFPSFIELKTF
jgi:predicted acyl esterase